MTSRTVVGMAGVVGVMMAVASAGLWGSSGAAAGPREPQSRPIVRGSQPTPDAATVPEAARRSFEEFWNGMPRTRAEAFERELMTLEARQRQGEPIGRDLERLRRAHPAFFQLSGTLQPARWLVASGGGGTQAVTYTCTGLSWIGRNGRLRCLGKLVAAG